MIEHVLILLVNYWSEKEQARRRAAEAKVKALSEVLRADSRALLLQDSVTIPAQTRPVETIVLAVVSTTVAMGVLLIVGIVTANTLGKVNAPRWLGAGMV